MPTLAQDVGAGKRFSKSGWLSIRVSKDLHRRVRIAAAEAGCSIQSLGVQALETFLGSIPGDQSPTGEYHDSG